MHFNVLFLDTTSNKYYDRMTLEKEALGGTEATVVRVAEGLASLGLIVGVIQTRCNVFEMISGQHCFFLHGESLPEELTCDYYIQIRRNANPQLFPESKKYLWMHDVAHDDIGFNTEDLARDAITVVGVSRWHKKNLELHLGTYSNITYVYNPVIEQLYNAPRDPQYDPNLMVWTASPHKGLGHALELFQRIKEKQPKMKLMVFNPGYFKIDEIAVASKPGVYYAGPVHAQQLWGIVKKALCVFYPTDWKETFGLIAAEANAIGTPVITNPLGALKEVIQGTAQFSDTDQEIIDKVLHWNAGYRPTVVGRDEFKLPKVINEWLLLFKKSPVKLITLP